MKNAELTLAAFAALALLAVDIYAQATETGGAAGFAATPSPTAQGIRCLDAAWASNNHVKASAYYADYDNDCLENWAEAALGTSPWTNDIAGVSAATAKSIGAFDLVPGAWKAAHGLSSPLSWSEDPDNDGWDNWSEWMAGTDPNAVTNRPKPRLSVTLDYHAALRGRLVIWAYSRFDMNGWPDAVYARNVSLVALPATVELTDADLVHGHLRQGANWFFAWVGSGSGSPLPSWSSGEPAAIADNQFDGIDIGFDLNEVTFHLTDRAESFARSSWHGSIPEDHGGYEVLIEGIEYFKYKIEWPRTWIHEWDVVNYNLSEWGANGLGLGAHASSNFMFADDDSPKTFDVKVRPEAMRRMDPDGISGLVITDGLTNWTHSVSWLPKPVLYGPVNREIVADARPEFKFRLDPEFTEFTFILEKNGTTIFNKRILAPGRFRNDVSHCRDLVIWKFPYSVGDVIAAADVSTGVSNEFSPGATYAWRVVPYSPVVRSYTATEIQNLAKGEFLTASGGWMSAVDVATVADNMSETNALRIAAYVSPACSGQPAAVRRISGSAASTANVFGLPGPGPWYIRADSSLATGFAAHGKRPVPIFAEPGDGPLSITNRIIIRDCK